MISAGLYVVATPIGNLEDISSRAISILKSVNLILAEDSRHSARLFQHYGIETPVQSYHEHNEHKLATKVMERLQNNQSVALVSDAGTPLINDPGFHLVNLAHASGIRVFPVPGASALVAALSVSGQPTDRFVYEGFLPAKTAARQNQLEKLSQEQRTLVFYEVPHRICGSLQDMADIFGSARGATLCKEISKQFETIHKDTLAGLLQWLGEDPVRQKGEFVLIVHGADTGLADDLEAARVLQILLSHLSVKEAASAAALILNDNKNRLYQMALELTRKHGK